ncbi:hypothetical protein FDP41_002809 [Naegleria fowleri]|uniref:tRNA pseudouridine synthase n=1 Tax=Naegleria fowleri TaxID=5763 RepID=A0A6A5BVK6_NAEFO|nr:uncharacterized protein FDP41_002809 [Naegleria fowleri]KAF0978294.1 hypothetical protein FDP41_002809 [Naegleria fowleri]
MNQHPPIFQRFKFSVQYDGTNYNGFQKQTNTQNTIQEKLEFAFHQLQFPNSNHDSISSSFQYLKKSLIPSSRTDKGVHAIRNTGHIDLCVNLERRRNNVVPRVPSSNVVFSSSPQQQLSEESSISLSPPFTCNHDDGSIQCLFSSTPNSLFSDMMKMKHLLNYYLRDEMIRILDVEPVHTSYHSKKNVLQRIYMYRIIDSQQPKTISNMNNYSKSSSSSSMRSSSNSDDNLFPLESHKIWCISEKLNIHAMKQACQYFIGTHDFTCFSSCTFSFKNSKKKISPIKTIQEMYIQECFNLFIPNSSSSITMNGGVVVPNMNTTTTSSPTCHSHHTSMEYRIFIKSKSFLKHQIRFMIQVLVKIGRNELPPECIQEYLKSRQRVESTKYMAPAHGLYLVDVMYSENNFNDDSDEFSD